MKSLFLTSLVCGAAVALSLDAQLLQGRQAAASPVNTTSGPVSGHASSNASTKATEYLGIPYAKPPVGDLRFAPPVAYNGTSAINGTSFGFSCPANTAIQGGSTGGFNTAFANITAAGFAVLTTLGQLGDKFSEDCLTLNVWVPSGGESKKAILLWIYGGGFSTGSSDTPTYNGQYLASQEDVIVVSINYRLNIFGFPGNPSIPNLNLGLLDQRLAVEWVRDNIGGFGGDSSRITIFGQSAGSASVDYYSYAYTSDPIVAGLIQESGTINGFGSVNATTANAAWFNITATLGCGSSSSNSSDVLQCMRTKSVNSILKAFPQTPAGSVSGGLSNFGPAVDDITVFSDYPARSAAGNFIKVPLLSGNADYEAGIFATIAALQNVTYPRSFWDAFNLQGFTCPAAVRANISISAGVPTWRYRYFGNFPNLRLTSVPDSGAWHASELPIIFNNLPSAGNGVPASTDEETSIGNYMRGAWAAFAKDPVNGLENYQGGWPTYDPAGNTLIRLAYNNVTGTNLALPNLYDSACPTKFAYNGTGNGTGNGNATTTGTATATGSGTRASGSASSTASTPATAGGNKASLSGFMLLSSLAFACLL